MPLTDLALRQPEPSPQRPDSQRPETIRLRSEQRARQIAEDVTEAVASGRLKPGDRLADERTLCRQYDTGRHTVRKAMDVLERQGLVGRFVGRGSFVLHAPEAPGQSAPGQSPDQGWTLLELTEARLLLEPGVAALAVSRASSTDLARLGQMLDGIGRAENWRSFKEAKYAFHRSIAQVARNRFVCDIFDRIVVTRRKAWDGYQPIPADLALLKTMCFEECRAILDAIARGDADGAADATRRSIVRLLVSIGSS